MKESFPPLETTLSSSWGNLYQYNSITRLKTYSQYCECSSYKQDKTRVYKLVIWLIPKGYVGIHKGIQNNYINYFMRNYKKPLSLLILGSPLFLQSILLASNTSPGNVFHLLVTLMLSFDDLTRNHHVLYRAKHLLVIHQLVVADEFEQVLWIKSNPGWRKDISSFTHSKYWLELSTNSSLNTDISPSILIILI